MSILSSYDILPIVLTTVIFYKQFFRQKTAAQNVTCDVINDITVLLVGLLDFNQMCYLSVILTGDLQKIVLCISGFAILHRSVEFYKIFAFNIIQPLQIIVKNFVLIY